MKMILCLCLKRLGKKHFKKRFEAPRNIEQEELYLIQALKKNHFCVNDKI